MGVLDILLIQELISAPTTVNSDYTSEAIDISFKEAEFSIQMNYNNGSSVNMVLFLEVSNDKTNWSRITESEQTITDDTGSQIYDLTATGVAYMRLGVEVTGGSIDINNILYKARRRH